MGQSLLKLPEKGLKILNIRSKKCSRYLLEKKEVKKFRRNIPGHLAWEKFMENMQKLGKSLGIPKQNEQGKN